MSVKVIVVILSAAGDGHHLSPVPSEHRADCDRRAACPQHQRLLPGNAVGMRPVEQRFKAVGIGIVAVDRPIGPAQEGVYAADCRSGLRQFVAKRNDGLLVGDRHVQPVPVPMPYEVLYLIGRFFIETIVIVRKLLVDLRRIAVTQLFTEQAALHLRPPHCNCRGTHTLRRDP